MQARRLTSLTKTGESCAALFARPSFGGHERFTFRHGWLKKGFDAVVENSYIFSQKDAFVVLGVGKNMAASIRYWGLTLGLFEPDTGRSRALRPSRIGSALFADDGWDPYLEDIGSLWLLHWKLASNQERGLVWYLAFSRYYDVEFHKSTLVEFLKTQLAQRGLDTTESMIEREFDVFIRTYVPARAQKKDGEENLGCPLEELNLIYLIPGESVYRFDVGPKPSLPSPILGYALLEFLSDKIAQQRTALVDECVYSPGSPGQIFKLDEDSVMNYLADLELLTRGALRVQETAGIRQIYLHATSRDLGWQLLTTYYG